MTYITYSLENGCVVFIGNHISAYEMFFPFYEVYYMCGGGACVLHFVSIQL